jgi:hypothetical protein
MKINKILNFLGPKPQTSFFLVRALGTPKLAVADYTLLAPMVHALSVYLKKLTDNVLFE